MLFFFITKLFVSWNALFAFSLLLTPIFDRSQTIFEMTYKGISSLNSSICKLTYFLAIEFIPPSTAKFIIKLFYELSMDEINKRISYVALVIVINREVQEVDFVFVILGNLFKKQVFRIFVGNMTNHKSRSSIDLDLSYIAFTFSGMILNYEISSLDIFLRFFCCWRYIIGFW